jgi:ferredoxin-NADP reductase
MAIIKKYKAEIVHLVNPAENLYTIEFKSLNGIFKFLPGQFLHLALDEYDPSTGWPESRCFSIQTPPKQETIKITFAVKGVFTKRMTNELFTGMQVDLKLPYGQLFQQHHDKNNCLFIAGGTGITPYLSLFNDASFSAYVNPVLYFGFRDKNYDLYKSEFLLAKKINTSFKIIKINQETDGILSISEIYQSNLDANSCFISGPQLMITDFKKYLLDRGVAKDFIRTDEWE